MRIDSTNASGLYPGTTLAFRESLSGRTAPKELHFKFRLPETTKLNNVTVNSHRVIVGGIHKDTAIFATNGDPSSR